jgi:hypothetical protein
MHEILKRFIFEVFTFLMLNVYAFASTSIPRVAWPRKRTPPKTPTPAETMGAQTSMQRWAGHWRLAIQATQEYTQICNWWYQRGEAANACAADGVV